MKHCVLSFSSGKDSVLCLHRLRKGKIYPDVEVKGLLTTVTADYQRVSMHGVRKNLLLAQAKSLGIPLQILEIPAKCSNLIYDELMAGTLKGMRQNGVNAMAFGDLFLDEIRKYREVRLKGTGIEPLFPLWYESTRALAEEILHLGFRAVVTCLNPEKVPPELCGSEYNEKFLRKLPEGVDPCGENGEFHTFVFAGPEFQKPLDLEKGETLCRDGYYFTDFRLKNKDFSEDFP